jgi:hypothetical protein
MRDRQGEQVIIQIWISTHFGVISNGLSLKHENVVFIAFFNTPARREGKALCNSLFSKVLLDS